MTVSLRLNDEDSRIIKSYAEIHGISVSELFRSAVLERIEDELDLQAFNESMEEYRKNPVSYSLEDVIKELELD